MTGSEFNAEEIDCMMNDGLAALEDEQYEVAADLFRRVVQAAPFRHDARDYLAFVLDQQFAREAGRAPQQKTTVAPGTSSAAAASTRYTRPVGFRVPMWFLAALCAVGLFGVVIFVIVPHLHFGTWLKNFTRQTDPSDVPPLPREIASEITEVNSAITSKQYDEALTILNALRETTTSLKADSRMLIDKKLGEVYEVISDSHIEKRNYDRALSSAEEGLKYAPSSSHLNFLIGLCCERKAIQAISEGKKDEIDKYYQRAVNALKKSIETDDKNLEARELLANSYIKLNQTGEAIKIWDQIISIAPESPQAEKARNYKITLGFPSQ